MDILGKGFADKDAVVKGIRRADNFAKMAVAASKMACAGFEFPNEDTDVSIIVASQFGPHTTTFKFLDNLLDYKDTGVSPTTFSHSVHNASTSYIASSLGICGQALTITCFLDPLKQALIMADAWLELQQAKKIVVCYVEEQSEPFVKAHKFCKFPSYSKDTIPYGASCILVARGNHFKVPEHISNPFAYIREL